MISIISIINTKYENGKKIIDDPMVKMVVHGELS